MPQNLIEIVVLAIAGLAAATVGGLILLDPITFHAGAGIIVDQQTALVNEMKAAGGALLAIGLVALAALFRRDLRPAALFTSALVYGAYGLARGASFLTDGVPNNNILVIAVLEAVIALACIVAFWRSSVRDKAG